MKNNILFFFAGFLLIANTKCKCTKNPMPTTYQTIGESKRNKAFIIEYKPEKAYIEIEGYKHYIKNAWLENAHVDGNWNDKITTNLCVSISLEVIEEHKPNLKKYIHEIGNGYTHVWLFNNNKNVSDTIELKYRSDLSLPDKNKIFRLFPILPDSISK